MGPVDVPERSRVSTSLKYFDGVGNVIVKHACICGMQKDAMSVRDCANALESGAMNNRPLKLGEITPNSAFVFLAIQDSPWPLTRKLTCGSDDARSGGRAVGLNEL